MKDSSSLVEWCWGIVGDVGGERAWQNNITETKKYRTIVKILLLSERSEVSEKEKKRGGEKRKEKRKKKEKGGEERRERRGREIGDFLTILNIFL